MVSIELPHQHPAGTATFLITGVELATPMWEMAPDAAAAAVARHRELIGSIAARHGGAVMEASGDGAAGHGAPVAAFPSSAGAVAAALAARRAFAREEWPGGLAVRVRIGIHTSETRGRDGSDPGGVERCARIHDVAHGGQTLLSAATAALVAGALPDGAWLVDLGVHRLRDLYRPEHLYELRHGAPAGDFPPPRSLDVLPNNLPAQLTSFVGRGGELGQVRRLLAEQRLVTLAGAGGCGKTRLAAQAAAALAARSPDGTWWVDLGPVTDPDTVSRLAAATLRVRIEPAGDPLGALAAQLRGRTLLLCLDTCEHLLDAAAELADALLRGCPGVSILATSREPLGVAGETVWRVPSMVEDEAVRLFADRAALVRPGFAATADDDAVRTICRRLDGIPLAIELAAAWVRALSPAQVAAGLGDRFRLLTGGQRGVIARHRTLAASIDWSHQLLDEADRVVFRRLAVFPGDFDLDAARAACAGPGSGGDDVLAALGRLIDKSLVVVREGAGETRFRLLDSLRHYAADRLAAAGETAAARDRHLAHFLAFAEAAERELDRDQDRWRAAMEGEHDNLRAALQWGLSGPPGAGDGRADPDEHEDGDQHRDGDAERTEGGRRLAAATARLWFLHGHIREGLGFLNRAVDLAPGDRSVLQAELLAGAAMVALGGGRPALGAAAAERGLEIAVANGDHRSRGRCLVSAASMPFFTDFAAAEELCRQARRYGRAAGDSLAADQGLMLEACLLTNRDRHREAVTLARELQARTMPRNDRYCTAVAGGVQVWAELFTGDLRRAEELAVESLRVAEPLSDFLTVGVTSYNLAWVLGLRGRIDAGRRLMEPIVRSVEGAGGDLELLPWLALAPGKLHLWGGDLAGAQRWFRQAARFAEPVTDNWVVARALPGLAAALRRQGRTGEAAEVAARGIALARRLDVPHVLAESLDESAFVAAADDPGRAEDLHHQALAVRVEHGLRTFYVDSLEALAGRAAHAEGFDEAARLLGASEAARELIGYPRPAVNEPDIDAARGVARAGLGADAFAAGCAAGAALSLDEAVGYVTRARGSRGRPATGWASLTPTEREVVELVVDGLSNPEIGAKLFMSRSTVKTHLSHVYAKLGVANRTELAGLRPGDRNRPEFT